MSSFVVIVIVNGRFCVHFQSLLVLLALAAFVVAEGEVQDQESAELFFRTWGYYPSWYSGFHARTYPGYAAYPGYAGYNYAYGLPYVGARSYSYYV